MIKRIWIGLLVAILGCAVAQASVITVNDLEIPEGQVFRVLDSSQNFAGGELTLAFNSEAGFTYDIQASSNLVDWLDLSTGIAGQAGSTTNLISDPELMTEEKRFCRAILTGD